MAIAAAFGVAGSVGAVTITYGPLAVLQDPLDGGPPTSVKAYWRTDQLTSDNTAYVGETPSGPWTLTGTNNGTAMSHEALVTGLTSDRTYFMYVRSNAAVSQVIEFRTGRNLLANGSFEAWHSVSGQGWGESEPDGWRGWAVNPWSPPGSHNPNWPVIAMDGTASLPTPRVKDQSHRATVSRSAISCYGGFYQEVRGLQPGVYTVSGWVAYSFTGADPTKHAVEILTGDGPVGSLPPTGTAVFTASSGSELRWKYVQGSVYCTSGTITVSCNLRSDDSDGSSAIHFDGMRLMLYSRPDILFSGFQCARTVSGGVYDITLTYDTDIPSTTQIEWGPTTQYGNTTPLDPNPTTHHVVSIPNVTPAAAPYQYRAIATAPQILERSLPQTFDAPLVTISNLGTSVSWGPGVQCKVTWNSSYPTSANKVFYRRVGSSGYIEIADASDPTPRTSHSVTLTNLWLSYQYEYYVQSGGADIIPASSSVQTFTASLPSAPTWLGMAMVGGSIPDGWDDVGPGTQVQRMVERDWPLITISGTVGVAWRDAQPNDPGSGPNVYDWSWLDSGASGVIPGKGVMSYYQMYGTSPPWVQEDTPRFWEKFEQFVEAMTIHINEIAGPVYYTFENEPNISRAPSGWNWADWYIHCLQHFYAAVHRANAVTGVDNKVIAGNLCGHSAGGFSTLYQLGLKNCSDILGYHAYPYDMRDGVEVADLAQIHAIQVQYGDGDKQIYVGEGWGSGRSAGFDRASPTIDPTAQEVENMWLSLVNGWDNVMTVRQNWDPSYLFGMKFFCGNDNWGAQGWRARATPLKDAAGNVTGFMVDGYTMDPDVAPKFWNGGLLDFYGNSKDCLIHVFPGDGLVFMNPGFELASEPPNAHLPHFWTAAASPAPETTYFLDDAVFNGGSRSLRLTQTSDGSSGVCQMTAKRSAQAGVSYRARVWCRTQDQSGLTARFYIRFCNPDGSVKSPEIWAQDLTGTADWRRMEVIATAPYGTSRIEAGCYIAGKGTAWFDDVTISQASQQEVGTVRGYTLDEGQIAVPDCIVRATTGGIQAVSDENGYYEIKNVPTGTYDFVCRKAGYVPHRVKNQTVTAGKMTFVSFNMGLPKPGLTVTEIGCDRAAAASGEPVTVTVTVGNSKPYPNLLSEVGVFVEQAGRDATDKFSIEPSEANPKTIAANGQAQFSFTLTPKAEAEGQAYSVNAYAYGQEDRPNLLRNGGFDNAQYDQYWTFSRNAQEITWTADSSEYHSPPRSVRSDWAGGGYSWSWAHNWSEYYADAVPCYPDRSYTFGVHHKEAGVTGGVGINVMIQEYYYDGSKWLTNGRRIAGIPFRNVWAQDYTIYTTGNPAVTPGLYATNRLRISCGPATTPVYGSGTAWWDDLYLKETGDWLADDRADSGAVFITPKQATTIPAAFSQPLGTYVRLSGVIVTAGSESFAGRMYVEQRDRAAGCMITPATGSAPAMGAVVNVSGKAEVANGERVLTEAVVEVVE